MFAFAGLDHIHLTASRRKGSEFGSLDAKKDQFSGVPEIETDSAPIRLPILAHFLPYDVGFVGEAPPRHRFQPLGKKCVWHPKIEMGFISRRTVDRNGLDVLQRQCAVTIEPLVLRRNFPRAVLKLPWRVGEDGENLRPNNSDEIC